MIVQGERLERREGVRLLDCCPEKIDKPKSGIGMFPPFRKGSVNPHQPLLVALSTVLSSQAEKGVYGCDGESFPL